jgi:hypothetical protein
MIGLFIIGRIAALAGFIPGPRFHLPVVYGVLFIWYGIAGAGILIICWGWYGLNACAFTITGKVITSPRMLPKIFFIIMPLYP